MNFKNLITLILFSFSYLCGQSLICEEGEIDLGWGDCNDLLTSNNNVGCMPSGCYSIEQTTELNYSYIFLGDFPPEIGELINLNYIHLSDCGINGQISSEIGNLINLTWLLIYDNNHGLSDSLNILIDSNISGEIPIEIGSLESLQYIRLENNELTGVIPIEIGNLESLTHLLLNGNQLTGPIPNQFCDIYSISLLDNQFCPPYPGCLTNEELGSQDTSNCALALNIEALLPNTYNLSSPYPNPFNPIVTIQFSVPMIERVTLKIYDVVGNEVHTIIGNELLSGTHTINWNASGKPNGIYFVRMNGGSFVDIKKITLLK